MKFFKLLFLAVLSLTVLTGCERQLVSPIDPTNFPQTNTQFAQKALSDLADTATKRAFVDLANAASEVAETLAIDDGTSVEPLFSKIAKLAGAVTILEQAFVEAGCEIELQKFVEASVDTVKAYTIRDAADMERALQHLAQEAVTAETLLRQFPAENAFIPFAFGYGPAIDAIFEEFYYTNGPDDPLYEPGVILIQYDSTIRPVDETRNAVIEFLALKGYTVQVEGGDRFKRRNTKWFHFKEYTAQVQVEEAPDDFEFIDLGPSVDPLLIMGELIDILGVAFVQPDVFCVYIDLGPSIPFYYTINEVAKKYNEAWCQGNFDVIDNILIEESGLDFFDYAFVRNLADIYAEEIPESAERIRMNRFSLRYIASEFLADYFWFTTENLNESIEHFRQSVRNGSLSIEHRTFVHYYTTTDYWKQLVTDHLNK